MKRYRDYREMLDKQKDIDAVVVATPDHMHATIAMAAMDLDKHVYVQKPLTLVGGRSAPARRARRAQTKVVTQMGNQGHSWDDGRRAVEWVQSGAIGDVPKCTCGRIVRSRTGRRAFRGRSRSASPPTCAGT